MLIKAAETITTGMSGSISLKLLVTSTCHFSKEFHHFVQNEKRIASLLPGRLYIVHALREHLDPAPRCTGNTLTRNLVTKKKKKPIDRFARNKEKG